MASNCSFSGGGVGISDAINVKIPCSTCRQVEPLCSSGTTTAAEAEGGVTVAEPACSAVVRVFCESVFPMALNVAVVGAVVDVSCPSGKVGVGLSLTDRCSSSDVCEPPSFLKWPNSWSAVLDDAVFDPSRASEVDTGVEPACAGVTGRFVRGTGGCSPAASAAFAAGSRGASCGGRGTLRTIRSRPVWCLQ